MSYDSADEMSDDNRDREGKEMIPTINPDNRMGMMVQYDYGTDWENRQVIAKIGDGGRCLFIHEIMSGDAIRIGHNCRPIFKKIVPLDSVDEIPNWVFGRPCVFSEPNNNQDIEIPIMTIEDGVYMFRKNDTPFHYPLKYLAEHRLLCQFKGKVFKFYKEVEE